MSSVERLRHGSRCDTHEPLFPGYLFVQLDQVSDNWYPIRSTRGVSAIVRFDGQPLPVQDEIIEAIQRRLAGCAVRVPYLRPGEHVRIRDGAFADLEGVFVANDGNERVVLLIRILQREQALSFPVASVRRSGTR
jgi:transcriptional antiterminator RfaH